MTSSIESKNNSPLRQRMIEDMTLRKLAPKTQSGYIRVIKNLAQFLGHSPATASSEELRGYQIHLANKGTSRISLNATVTALRFLYTTTLGRHDVVAKISSVPVPRKLPDILNKQEVTRLIEAAATTPKYQAALSVAYGAGLRINEIVSLKISDIDSKRMAS